jgi:hypothetical protein
LDQKSPVKDAVLPTIANRLSPGMAVAGQDSIFYGIFVMGNLSRHLFSGEICGGGRGPNFVNFSIKTQYFLKILLKIY